MIERGKLQIMRYRALNGTWYRICYYRDAWRFVHIQSISPKALPSKKNRNGKKYIEYEGTFSVDDIDGTIII